MTAPSAAHPWLQLFWLFILAIPISCIAWTVTHEEVFKEPREFCQRMSRACRSVVARKFFYLFTCEYCFSHWVTLAFLAITRYRLLLDDWRGFLISFFATVWLANVYMSLYSRLRVDITSERTASKVKEKQAEKLDAEVAASRADDTTQPGESSRPAPPRDQRQRQPVESKNPG
jgi:hypothetical protein